jgi:hypothetical protein
MKPLHDLICHLSRAGTNRRRPFAKLPNLRRHTPVRELVMLRSQLGRVSKDRREWQSLRRQNQPESNSSIVAGRNAMGDTTTRNGRTIAIAPRYRARRLPSSTWTQYQALTATSTAATTKPSTALTCNEHGGEWLASRHGIEAFLGLSRVLPAAPFPLESDPNDDP